MRVTINHCIPWKMHHGVNIFCGNLNVLRHFYLSFQVQLLHFLVAVSYPNEGAGLWLLLSTTIPFHLLFFFLPSTAHKIHTWRGTKEPENEKWIVTLHPIFKKKKPTNIETQTDIGPKLSQSSYTLHYSLYTHALHLHWRFPKMQIKKKRKRKISIRCTVTKHLSSSMTANSISIKWKHF